MPRSNVLALTLLILAAILSLGGTLPSRTPIAPQSLQKAPGTAELAEPLAGSPPPIRVSRWAQQTATRLESVDAPGRDLIALTQRLKLHGTGDIPLTVNASAPNYPVGARQQFY